MIKIIIRTIKQDRRSYIFLFLAVILLAIIEFYFLKEIAETGVSINSAGNRNLAEILLPLIVLSVLVSTFRTVQTVLVSSIQNLTLNKLVSVFSTALLNSDYIGLKKKSEPDYLAVVDKLDLYFRDFIIPVTSITSAVTFLLVLIGSVALYNPDTLYFVFIFALYFWFYHLIIRKSVKKLYSKVVDLRNTRVKYLYTLISGIFDIRSQGLAETLKAEIVSNEAKIRSKTVNINTKTVLAKHWLETFALLGLVTAIFLYESTSDLVSVMIPLAYVAYRCMPFISQIQVSFTQLQNGIHIRAEIDEIVSSLQSNAQALISSKFLRKHNLKVNKVMVNCIGFDKSRLSLTCDFSNGNIATLSTPSGYGKSTVVHALAGFVKGAKVTVDDLEMGPADQIELVRLVSQRHYLHSEALLDLEHKDLYNLLKSFKISQIVTDNNIGYNGQNISGGQRNRLAIIDALLTDKRIIVFDETLAGIESEVQFLIIKRLTEFSNKRFIIITHEKPIIEFINNHSELKKL